MNGLKKKKKRPELSLPLTKYEKILEFLSGAAVLFNILFTIAVWGTLPESIPTHFGAAGTPDGWGGKGSLAFLAVGALLMYMLLTVVSRFPYTFNYPWKITEGNAQVQYQNARYLLAFLKTEVIGSFVYIQLGTIRVALGKAEGLGRTFLPVFLVLIFGTIGVYFYKSWKYR